MTENVLADPGPEARSDPPRQCTATNRSGDRCRRAPIIGGHVCHLHGGAVPAVQQAARERLMQTLDPALYAARMVIVDLTAEWERNPNIETYERLARPLIDAIYKSLDRCGFHPTLSVQTSSPGPSFAGMSLAQLADRADQIAIAARRAANAEAQRLLPPADAVDGVVDAGDRLGPSALGEGPRKP